jgi:hypothetical protein
MGAPGSPLDEVDAGSTSPPHCAFASNALMPGTFRTPFVEDGYLRDS